VGNNNWEYSGFSDPGIDVGYYIVDAMYDIKKQKNSSKNTSSQLDPDPGAARKHPMKDVY